ncbi:AAA family ATPase [Murimonas intestini]|uniref:AAA family ATPase n=1 Tax=Murimonas intestini TaxID=1337051 RepID=UPI0011DD3D5A|nr:AAA family ATPase [Murimonas intestini]
MGIYLNGTGAYRLYKGETIKPYFVDKSQMLEELFPMVDSGNSHICITRPRRFGKTVMANMVASFFSKGCDAQDVFQNLAIARHEKYSQYRNQFSVIHISFNDISRKCTSYEDYIGRIEKRLVEDLRTEYPSVKIDEEGDVIDTLLNICGDDPFAGFIFVLDEWDFIFHQDFVTEEDKKNYLLFLRSLLKDRPYVLMAYMTGILPIAKYSSGSELNMFAEFTMAKSPVFSDYFGFTETEVSELYERYLLRCKKPRVTMEGLRNWYNGYHTASGERVYNPRSVILALSYNSLESYWTSAGPYDEIYYYIEHNVGDVRNDLALMVSGIPVPAKIQEYAATSMNLQTKDEIFSAMVVYGFLSYENGKVCIPNKELMEKFADMLQKEPSFGYVYRLAKESERMLQATLAGDTETMAQILELAHDTEVPLLSYNNETELTAVVNLVYLSARDTYRVEREDKAGIGYVDFIFYPEMDKSADCIILELKVDATPDAAIQQIRDKKYALKFQSNMAGQSKYTGRVLAVGISYDRTGKKHQCKIEVLEEQNNGTD